MHIQQAPGRFEFHYYLITHYYINPVQSDRHSPEKNFDWYL